MEPDAVEIRVVGCLIEKQRTTPDVYPLSLNALRLACNQSTNRDPVVDYDEETVVEALRRLALRGWTRLASGAGSRARKYRHLLDEALDVDPAEISLLAVLMLRGAQTPGQLKQRSERLHDFADLAAVHEALERLVERGFVARHPRRPGQKEDRYEHLLGKRAEAGGDPERGPEPELAGGGAAPPPPPAAASPPPPAEAASGEDRLARIERELAELARRAKGAARRARRLSAESANRRVFVLGPARSYPGFRGRREMERGTKRPGWIATTLCLWLAAAIAAPGPAPAEVVQEGSLRVSVSGKLTPKRLPRRGRAPVSLGFGGRFATTDGSGPPRLREISIAINRHGRIDPATSREALSLCHAALVGRGSFRARVRLPQQSPFHSRGKVWAFNGTLRGRPAILAHIYGTEPAPTSFVLPFLIRRGRGAFGMVLEASLPEVTGEWGFVTGISMTLGRRFASGGGRRSYLSAGCSAPPGFGSASFPLARASFAFVGGKRLTSTLVRGCKVRRRPPPG